MTGRPYRARTTARPMVDRASWQSREAFESLGGPLESGHRRHAGSLLLVSDVSPAA